MAQEIWFMTQLWLIVTHFVANLDRVALLCVIIQMAPQKTTILLTYDLQNNAHDLSNPLLRQKSKKGHQYMYILE